MSAVIEVKNLSEPDEIVRFEREGQSRTFGRDDDVCDLVIWSALNDRRLSRVAGVLWRMDGQLWLRNLSLRHELVVTSPGGVATPTLPPRSSVTDPGAAQALSPGTQTILGPAGCELVVRQRASARPPRPRGDRTDRGGSPSRAETTSGVPEVPDRLLQVALALCEPLMTGHLVPATYRQIAQRLGIESFKRVRLLVADLCSLYESDACATYLRGEAGSQARHGGDRLPQAAGGSVHDPADQVRWERSADGVWRGRTDDAAGCPGPPPQLSLPAYFQVAQLLVRRGLVRADHLVLLDAPPASLR